eukprot:s5245_g2.t1
MSRYADPTFRRTLRSDALGKLDNHTGNRDTPSEGASSYTLDIVPLVLRELSLDLSVDAWDKIAKSVLVLVPPVSSSGANHTRADIDSIAFRNNISEQAESFTSGTLQQFGEADSFLFVDAGKQTPWFDDLTREQLIQKLNERDHKSPNVMCYLG